MKCFCTYYIDFTRSAFKKLLKTILVYGHIFRARFETFPARDVIGKITYLSFRIYAGDKFESLDSLDV
jgi:hypothetical protein